MFQSSFTGIKPLHLNENYIGGFCQFWYIPIEDVSVFPRINAINQYLATEPVLVAGKSWFGPIKVPRDKLGYQEDFERTKAGPFYKTRLEAIHIGDSPESTVNLENMPYHRYLVVGKLRAGGFYKIIGTVTSPCFFIPEYKTGNGPAETTQTSISFSTEHISKAYILPEFTADTTGQVIGGGAGGDDMPNQKEIIPFDGVPLVAVPWTATRSGKFGSFPIVEVWMENGADPPYLNTGADIKVDAAPGLFTELTVTLGPALGKGFIVIT
jgi:hypothetical protein